MKPRNEERDAVRRDTRSGDVHVYPFPRSRPHHWSSSCWCRPTVNYTAPNGNIVWLHRDAN